MSICTSFWFYFVRNFCTILRLTWRPNTVDWPSCWCSTWWWRHWVVHTIGTVFDWSISIQIVNWLHLMSSIFSNDRVSTSMSRAQSIKTVADFLNMSRYKSLTPANDKKLEHFALKLKQVYIFIWTKLWTTHSPLSSAIISLCSVWSYAPLVPSIISNWSSVIISRF